MRSKVGIATVSLVGLLSACGSSYDGTVELTAGVSDVIAVSNCSKESYQVKCTFKNLSAGSLDSYRAGIRIRCYAKDGVAVDFASGGYTLQDIDGGGSVREGVCPDTARRIVIRG